MKNLSTIGYLLLLMFVNYQQTNSTNPVITIQTVVDIAETLYTDGIKKFLTLMEVNPNDEETIRIRNEVSEKLIKIYDDIENIKIRLKNQINKQENRLKSKLIKKLMEIYDSTYNIQVIYNNFLINFKDTNYYKLNSLQFAKSIINPINSTLNYSLYNPLEETKKMHNILVNSIINKDSPSSIMAKQNKPSDITCMRNQSPQQLINDIYELIVLSEIETLMMYLYSYDVCETIDDKSYEELKDLKREEFNVRLSSTFNKIKKAMSIASREIFMCDTKIQIKDITYTKVQEVFQGYFLHEKDSATRLSGTAAFRSCASLEIDRMKCSTDTCKLQPFERRCNGIIRDCQSVSYTMQICHALNGSDRRYNWMNTNWDTNSGSHYGNNEKCQDIQNLYGNALIENCFCTCESEDRNIDRYFSLTETTSNRSQNKVITGIRFVKRSHIFYIQIQEGKLGPKGTIIGKPEWKPVNMVTDNELTSSAVSTYHAIEYESDEVDEDEKVYVGYRTFHHNDLVYAVTDNKKTVYLDDLETKEERLLTGLRFKQDGLNLKLEIQTTRFDYESGLLIDDAFDKNEWISNFNSTEDREEILLEEPGDPRIMGASDTFSYRNKYIKFRTTDLHRDLSQYTIPFLDLQEVVSNPSLPLSGAGIYHKGKINSGGFLALKLFQYDLTRHL